MSRFVPTSYTRVKNRDSKQRLCRRMKNDEILGFVEKELGEVVGSQMEEQVFQLTVSPPSDKPFQTHGDQCYRVEASCRGTVQHLETYIYLA